MPRYTLSVNQISHQVDVDADNPLLWVLPDEFPGYYLYYPNRSQYSPAFSLFVEAMRHLE